MNLITQIRMNSEKLSKINTTMFHFLIACIISISLIQASYAQTQLDSEKQITFSDNLLNDPAAQDILKKIEQTKKMITELEEKEYEKNQARENLEKMREMSVKSLNQKLSEWERLWEKHSSRNAFDSFVNKKPEYVQGVFWDQFEFKEKKINEGRIAMNQVLTNGGSMQDARDAYHKAASTKKIELIEMNAQFNVKHNLAYYGQQQLFNSTGQFHPSPTSEQNIAQYYTDYRLDPTYLLANPDDGYSATHGSQEDDAECRFGYTLVHRSNQNDYVCIGELTAQIWERYGMGEIVNKIELSVDENSRVQNVPTNPGTECIEGYSVLYNIPTSEYRCVSDSTAKKWTSDGTGEVHDLLRYILGKDQYKVLLDKIYEINQEILRINEEHNVKIKKLESRYETNIEDEDTTAKQKMRKIINEYNSEKTTKEDVTKRISEIRDENDLVKEKLLKEKIDAVNRLESELREKILKTVKGYENNPGINVDWDQLNQTSDIVPTVGKENEISVKASPSNKNMGKVLVDNIGAINSFGQEFDEIKSNQILQVAADITNTDDYKHNFAYMVEITNDRNVLVQAAKWVTGTLNPGQAFNVGLSWIPEESGEFNAAIYLGATTDSVSHISDLKINVIPERQF
ncbi:MAG: hypothetical protein OEM28_13000 [Nitrosopumilus sp.]|nr:hypothetical protein [Nitrosopumilus sp.]